MESYEKKYKEAVKKIRNLFDEGEKKGYTIITYKKTFEEIFPELAESEDEKIRNRLIHIVNGCLGVAVPEPEKSQLIAWLEKQNSNVDNANKEYWRGYREGKQEILDKYAELEKQGEQKPVWGKEDEKIITGIINDIQKRLEDYPLEQLAEIYFKEIKWLKSLKDRVQPKQEWGEEDEKIFDEIVGDLEALELKTTSEKYSAMYKKELSWLKSLKPRNMWKPSDEQMDALNCARWNAPFNIEILDSLYNDLKKLTE